MRLSKSERGSRSWRIEEIAPDFDLEDAWALPVHGGADDFARLIEVIAALDPANGPSRATRELFRIRYRLGGWFGWDDDAARKLPIPGATETSLITRLPSDLRDSASNVDLSATNFTPLYLTQVEFAAEISNQTVHAVMHLAWIDHPDGRYQGQMRVFVKPRGRFGAGYMAAIRPFRHHVVYPALMRQIERAWAREGPAKLGEGVRLIGRVRA